MNLEALQQAAERIRAARASGAGPDQVAGIAAAAMRAGGLEALELAFTPYLVGPDLLEVVRGLAEGYPAA